MHQRTNHAEKKDEGTDIYDCWHKLTGTAETIFAVAVTSPVLSSYRQYSSFTNSSLGMLNKFQIFKHPLIIHIWIQMQEILYLCIKVQTGLIVDNAFHIWHRLHMEKFLARWAYLTIYGTQKSMKSTYTKERIYQSMVLSTILHKSETWPSPISSN